MLFAVADASDSHACSLSRMPPTNFELVRDATTIVVAHTGKVAHEQVSFEITRVLKGDSGMVGATFSLSAFGKYRGPSKTIAEVRPGALAGMCFAMDYANDRDYVMFVRISDKQIVLDAVAMSRVNEEVSATWLAAVENYVAIAKLSKAGQRKKLRALVAIKKSAKAETTDQDREIADDAQAALTALAR
jgi:hypothetical protein